MNWKNHIECKGQFIEVLQMKYLIYDSHMLTRCSINLSTIINWLSLPEYSFTTIRTFHSLTKSIFLVIYPKKSSIANIYIHSSNLCINMFSSFKIGEH